MKKAYYAVLGAWFLIVCPVKGICEERGVDIHGFLSQGYLLTTGNNYIADSTDGTFQFNEMGLNFTTRPSDKLRMGIQFFARDFGSVGNDKIVVDWASADYRLKDWLGFRAGKLKNPMGLYNETRDIDMLRTTILLPVSPYDEPYRESLTSINGVGIYGDINSENWGTLNYQVICGTTNIDPDGGTALFISQGVFDVEQIDVERAMSGSLVYTDPNGILRAGASSYFTEMAFDGVIQALGEKVHFNIDNVEIYAASLELTWNSFVFTYEYAWGHTTLIAQTENYGNFPVDPYEPLGYYGSISYRINPYLEAGYFRTEYFSQANNRDGVVNLQFSGHEYRQWHKDDVFSLRIDINENWLFKLETHYVDGTVKLYEDFNPDGYKSYWWMHLAKISFKF